MTHKTTTIVLLGFAGVLLAAGEALACPICFGGDPDSDIARGMNWAVFMLLGVTGGVLTGFIGFIFHLIKRSRQALGQPEGDRFNG
ncbi:MAG: hypothetical protein OXF27_04915 [Acidobacteria bacterium]|nr:hypothetical protein [Acidobacteriota bacterium]